VAWPAESRRRYSRRNPDAESVNRLAHECCDGAVNRYVGLDEQRLTKTLLEFGMSKADVRHAYPAAVISEAMCASPSEVRAGRDCMEMELEEVQAAGLAWRVRFSFTKDNQLSEIHLEVKSPADATFHEFKRVAASLNKAYAAASAITMQSRPAAFDRKCIYAHAKPSVPVPRRQGSQPKEEYHSMIERTKGTVTAIFALMHWCNDTADSAAGPLRGESPRLSILYARRLPIDTSGL
jgi:hypothetical protein